MSKIKINLASGVSLEKPLLNAFKNGESVYVILDNEMNGSMGLPIILVSKLVANKLVKIVDQNEWTQVKESLKQIIAGTQLEYVSVGESISADDIYYTQLTLPVPSFDALRNAYQPVVNVSAPVENPTPVENTSVMPDVVVPTNEVASPSVAEPVMPSVTPNVEPVMPSVNVEPEQVAPMDIDMNEIVNPIPSVTPNVVETPVMPEAPAAPSTPEVESTPVMESAPAIEVSMPTMEEPTVEAPAAPAPEVVPVAPVMPEAPVIEPTMPVMPEAPAVEPTPVVEPVTEQPTTLNEDMLKAQKDAFLEACSNMFDALVEQFKKNINQ